MEETELLAKVTESLRWAMFYAEKGHESMYPRETYKEDGYVAISVAKARSALADAESYITWIKSK